MRLWALAVALVPVADPNARADIGATTGTATTDTWDHTRYNHSN